jgi:hypothetical protein
MRVSTNSYKKRNPVFVQVTFFLTSPLPLACLFLCRSHVYFLTSPFPLPLACLGRAHVSVQNALRHKSVVAQLAPNGAPVFSHVVVERFLVRVNLVANSTSRIARVRVQVI